MIGEHQGDLEQHGHGQEPAGEPVEKHEYRRRDAQEGGPPKAAGDQVMRRGQQTAGHERHCHRGTDGGEEHEQPKA